MVAFEQQGAVYINKVAQLRDHERRCHALRTRWYRDTTRPLPVGWAIRNGRLSGHSSMCALNFIKDSLTGPAVSGREAEDR